MNLVLAVLIIFLLNLPFGYWRRGEKKFSGKWFLAIHIPVPIVIAIRYIFDLGFDLYTYPILIAAFFTGQLLGSLYRQKKIAKNLKKGKV